MKEEDWMKIEHNFKGVTYIRIGCMQGLYAKWNQTAFELSENICKYICIMESIVKSTF